MTSSAADSANQKLLSPGFPFQIISDGKVNACCVKGMGGGEDCSKPETHSVYVSDQTFRLERSHLQSCKKTANMYKYTVKEMCGSAFHPLTRKNPSLCRFSNVNANERKDHQLYIYTALNQQQTCTLCASFS
jgi:hypothetical protein